MGEEAPDPPMALAFSSLSPDKVVASPSNVLPLDNFRVHQELLKGVATNSELKESTHSLIDILAAVAPSRVALSVNEVVFGPVRALWQTPSCLPLQNG